jgi:arylsulfatase A-like enzyme
MSSCAAPMRSGLGRIPVTRFRLAAARRMGANTASALLAALLLVLAAGCRSQSRPTDVLLVVVDTLRADRLGAYGNGRGLTPTMDRLAARGTRFARAYAPSSWTMPSVASLLTSRLPAQHLVSDFDSRLADGEVTFGERLAAVGFMNGGFTANWRLRADLGYGQGFANWQTFMGGPEGGKARGEVLRQAALAWIDAPRPHGEPQPRRLLYLQYMEPHAPFEAPAALRSRFGPAVANARAAELNKWAVIAFPPLAKLAGKGIAQLALLYDAEVAAVDAELGQLFNALEERGLLDRMLVIVTADHGEEFLEHGAIGHGHNLFNTTVRIPLIIAGRGIPAGRVVQEPVSLIDLAPTLLDALGLPPEPRFEGRSLLPLLRDPPLDRVAAPDIVVQLPRTGAAVDVRRHRDGLVRDDEKVLIDRDDAAALYDLAADPGEQHPRRLASDAALAAALDAALASLATRQQPHEEKAALDDATKEKLRALGYHR